MTSPLAVTRSCVVEDPYEIELLSSRVLRVG